MENWIEKDIGMIAGDLLIIGRQGVATSGIEVGVLHKVEGAFWESKSR